MLATISEELSGERFSSETSFKRQVSKSIDLFTLGERDCGSSQGEQAALAAVCLRRVRIVPGQPVQYLHNCAPVALA